MRTAHHAMRLVRVLFSTQQVNAWGDQPTLEMVRLIVEWGGFCFLDKDKRGDFKVFNLGLFWRSCVRLR